MPSHQTTRFCLIRHGETVWNAENRIQGHTNIRLNETGLKQAEITADWLARHHPHITALYSSDLGRAEETARIIGLALKLRPIAMNSLRERNYGHFEGMTYTEAEHHFPDAFSAFSNRQPDFPIPGGGENLNNLSARIVGALLELVTQHPGESIAIVCHGGVLDVINHFVRNKPLHEQRDFQVPNLGLNWITFTEKHLPSWQIEIWADTRHLAR